ncbi:hypothetical protein UFOVP972_280 [uncultured Caudovirales phage]|jgi:hypothetical protein|uniref:Uncharacterized protein n=1 Tax=uncultured Caudovirales phage TaxID=2100421 RepID=A0A6J5PYD8_9CAUD|nr:hypothetical protein UFOVP972_280 [uncultured Caudovirales phage]
MKTIAIIFFALLSFSSISQVERIESTQLDSLIWKKINEYRITQSLSPFIVFEDSLMRKFCTRVAYGNFNRSLQRHSDSVGYWSNAECLYRYETSGSFFTNIISDRGEIDLELLAQKAVQGWIHSPTHEAAISRSNDGAATIVSIISIDRKNKSIKFDATFHSLDKSKTTFNGYVYPITKKGNR